MKPFEVKLNLENGFPDKWGRKIERRLSDLSTLFFDSKEVTVLLEKSDPLIYMVFESQTPREEGQLIFGTSIIYPGKVGSEYFMTKGHYHEKPDTAEIYFCLKGKGYLIMESLEGETSIIFMQSGSIGYVPPRWAHRTANTGDEPLICFYSVPADAGHDYEEIAKSGFKVIAIEIKREAKVVSLKDIHKIY